MQIKYTLRSHIKPIPYLPISVKQMIAHAGMWNKGDTPLLLVGVQVCLTTMKGIYLSQNPAMILLKLFQNFT